MKHPKRPLWFLAALAAVFCALAAPAHAEEAENGDEGIPAYAIGRLMVNAGTAWVKTAETGDWEEASTNTPLAPNSRVSVPEGSEAELQFHGGQFVLLTSGTDIEVREMAEDRTYFRLRAGEIRFDLPGDDFAPVTVRVPGGARAKLSEPGKYWLTVTDEDTTHLVVRRGKATASQEGETYRVEAGQEAEIGRNIAVSQYRGGEDTAPPPEPLSEEERKAGVPPVVGYELRDYGEWVVVPSYGYVWRPRVAAGWSPYVYGRWTWVSPYGWTWVSYEPWGWYPYHSGYWVNDVTFGWIWSPYGSFVSVGFVWSSYDYYHHHPYHHHRGFRYRPSNARFIPEDGNVRWEPMRPGERYRRPEFRPNDPRLRSFNRPLESGRVFMAPRQAQGAGPGAGPAGGPDRRQWRDVKEVRSERQQAIRIAPPGGARKDTRQVRPEQMHRAPSGAPAGAGTGAPMGGRTIEQRPSGRQQPSGAKQPSGGGEIKRDGTAPRQEQKYRAPSTRQGAPTTRDGAPSPTVTTPRQSAPAPQTAPKRDSAPSPRYTPQRDSAPAPQTAPKRDSAPSPRYTPQRDSAPAPQAAPKRDSAPAQRYTPQRDSTPAPQAAPPRQSAPSRQVERAPSYQGSERGAAGGGMRSNGGGGGGDRGGGGGGRGGGREMR
jgi:uncharacterized membrane protein YgcG